MSAGGIVGLTMNTLIFVGLWTIIGVAVDKLGQVFNTSIAIMPTMQDAVTGFSIAQSVYAALPVIMFIFLLINYFVNENAQTGGEV